MFKVKSLLFLGAAFALQMNLSLADDSKCPKMYTKECDWLHKTCVEQSNVDEALVAEAQKGNFIEDAGVKRFIVCCYTTSGLITEDGDLLIEKLVNVYPDEIRENYEPQIRKCGFTISGKGLDEDLLAMTKCQFAERPEYAYLP